MAKYLGIDVGSSHVRAVLLRTSYRRIAIEAMTEHDRRGDATLEEAVRQAASPLIAPGESVAVNLEGEKTFVRRIEVPAAAHRQLTEVLPYELEAELPFELSDAVYDYALLRRSSDDESVPVFAVVARTEDVRARIALVKDAIGEEPERVSPGGLALASLSSIVPELAGTQIVALFDLEPARSELVILDRGEPVFARTLSRGTEGLPDSAPALVREFRQSLAAWRMSGGTRPEIAYLIGPGANTPNAREFLQEELDVPIESLPAPRIDEGRPEDIALVPRFAKAVSLALALGARGRGYNLRRGVLTYERGYGFLRDRVPLLSGLFMVVIVSFFFSTWAELHALAEEKKTLESALTAVTTDVLGEGTDDPQHAVDLLDKTATGADEDPLPHADAFDVMVQIAQAVPESMTHDIEELDVQRGHVTVHGIVPTIPDAQQIATQLKNVRCFQDVKITRTNQVVGEERQKYVMELDIKCPGPGKEKTTAGAPAASASGGKP
jgi:general secretion pathway protein L